MVNNMDRRSPTLTRVHCRVREPITWVQNAVSGLRAGAVPLTLSGP